MRGRLLVVLTLAGVLALVLGVPFVLKQYYVEIAIVFFINLILAQSFRLVTTTGDWGLAHVVLMGVGGYAVALMSKLLGVPFWAAVPLAGLASAAVGLALIVPLLRTKGFGFFIASFALGEFMRLVWIKFYDPFGGPRGMIGIPSPSVGSLDLSGHIAYYMVVLGVCIACLAVMYRIDRSRIGDAWKAIHTDDMLAECLGISVPRYRTLAFVTGAFFAGIAGALLAYRLGAVNPRAFEVTVMLYLIIWVVVGGTATFWGPIIGTVVVTIAFEWTRPLLEWRPLMFGALLILFLIFLPGGLESLIPKLGAAGQRSPGGTLARLKDWLTTVRART